MTLSSYSIYKGFKFYNRHFKSQKGLFLFALDYGFSVAQRMGLPYTVYELYTAEGDLAATYCAYED